MAKAIVKKEVSAKGGSASGGKKANPIVPVMAGMVGAVVGGVAVATSMFMGDRKNRQKVKDALNDKKTEVKEKVINEVNKI